MGWLDDQPPKSVVYVSFGSLVVITRDQIMEFWYGLVNSGVRFLWVLRPDFIAENDGSDWIPTELAEATNERGVVVERMVRDLMDPEEDNEFRDSAEKMAKLARTSSGFGGSSYRHLERLILDIKNMAAHRN
ncbi:hypothetical protein NL676_004193 [Syzygium grande]|nr:hypothetical protein NL676_004193 [Syzygium grande]